jgi:hypothetical protein
LVLQNLSYRLKVGIEGCGREILAAMATKSNNINTNLAKWEEKGEKCARRRGLQRPWKRERKERNPTNPRRT